ncbi:hypothetical protein WJX73_005927 [Symbiochloris irregularis]|uniref:glycerol kinase n=1 Tax=Symbiochloris irregularis TaxID=706552 RepID=A0AAW1PYM5_9CHLO
MECIGAVDQGTQSTRFILYDNKARVVSSHAEEFKQISQHPGWLEHDPYLGGQDHLRGTTGLPISTYFSAYKWVWLVEHVPAVADAVREGRCVLGTIDTWLIWNLTGGPQGGKLATDVTNASRTSLMDLQTLQWHTPTLKLFGLSEGMLARIHSSAEEVGRVRAGHLAGVPITGCLGDQSAALLGQRCRQHEVKNTYGTGCFCLLHTGRTPTPSRHGLLTTVARQLGPKAQAEYALEGSIGVAGMGITWLRDSLGLITSAQESEDLAASVPSTQGVYFVPAFSGLLAPHWRDDARGTIVGISGSTRRAHIVRAMLEAMCWQTREVIDAMKDDVSLEELKLLRADGGASRNNLLMQLQADTLQMEVERPGNLETTSLGAAFAAGIGAGVWTEEWVLSQHHAQPAEDENMRSDKHPATAASFQPAAVSAEVERRYTRWRKAVAKSLDQDDLADE